MKRTGYLYLAFILLVILLIASASLISSSSDNAKAGKTDIRVSEAIAKEGKAKVIVMLKDSAALDSNGKNSIKQAAMDEVGKERIKHEFSSFNGFSASLTEKELEKLQSDKNVQEIYYDHPVYLSLQDSAPLINATATWPLQFNGLNLTGKGQTVCVIDTGVNYTHPDLGGCIIANLSLSGNISNLSTPVESSHPYPDNYDNTWQINGSNFTKIAIHFVNISTEAHYDYVEILNGNKTMVAVYSGTKTDLWTPSVEGNTIYIRLVSDIYTNDSGFYADQIIDGTTNLTYNWSSCSKVIGGWDIYNSDPDPMDDNGHGTHVSGIVAANGSIRGVAPEANIVSVKVFPASGSTTDSDIVKAIEWCTNQSSLLNISVISMSLAGSINYSDYCDAEEVISAIGINAAVAKNISVVVASGNNKNYTAISAPACIQNATPVGSSNKSDAISSFSNRNWMVQLFAPGSSINSTYKPPSGYAIISGTSMATPHVSGAIAILREYMSINGMTKTPQQIESVLNSTGKVINDASSGLNFSRIDVYAAVDSIENPRISFALPTENTSYINRNYILVNLTASDLSLSNITLRLFNSTYSLINTTSSATSPLFANFSNLSDGTYYFNATAYDSRGNVNMTETRNVTIDTLTPSLTSINASTITESSATIGWNSSEQTNYAIFYGTNSSILNSSTNSSSYSTLNSAVIYFLSRNTTYYYNLSVCDRAGNCNSSSSYNFTTRVDTTAPTIDVLSPIAGYSTTSRSITFTYQVNDTSNVANCSLIIDNAAADTSASITKNTNISFIETLPVGSCSWKITCMDEYSNTASSGSRSLTITTSTTDTGSPTGGTTTTPVNTTNTNTTTNQNQTISNATSYIGSATTVIATYLPAEEHLSAGYTKELMAGEKIEFILKKKTGLFSKPIIENHTIEISKIENESLTLIVTSDPIILNLKVGDEKRLNLSSADYYDFYIKLNSINSADSSANVTIKTIYEPITGGISPAGFFEFIKKNYIILIIAVVVIIALVTAFVFRREAKRYIEHARIRAHRRKENVRIKKPLRERYKR